MHNRLNNSYLRAEDKVYGWGNRSYFTFFSEFNRESPSIPYIEATVLCLLFVFSTIANTAVLVTLIRHRCLRTVTNIFICNLTFSDLLYTLSGPLIAAVRISESWNFRTWTCSTMVYMEFVCGSVSIWTMVMISVERYMCIVKDSSGTFTSRIAIIVIILVWSVALLFFTPILLCFGVKSFPFGNTTVEICTLEWPKIDSFRYSYLFTPLLLLFYFITPFIVLTHNYLKIFYKFRTSRRLVKGTRIETDSTWSLNRINLRKQREARDIKVIKILFTLVIIFAVMWIPIFGVFVLILVDNATGCLMLGSFVLIIAICCSMGNACVNPILYGLTNEKVRILIMSCMLCQSEELSVEHPNHPGPQQQDSRPPSLHSIAPIPEEQTSNNQTIDL